MCRSRSPLRRATTWSKKQSVLRLRTWSVAGTSRLAELVAITVADREENWIVRPSAENWRKLTQSSRSRPGFDFFFRGGCALQI